MHITNKFTVELGQAYSHRSINDYSFAVAGVNCIQHSCMRNEQLFLDTTASQDSVKLKYLSVF